MITNTMFGDILRLLNFKKEAFVLPQFCNNKGVIKKLYKHTILWLIQAVKQKTFFFRGGEHKRDKR